MVTASRFPLSLLFKRKSTKGRVMRGFESHCARYGRALYPSQILQQSRLGCICAHEQFFVGIVQEWSDPFVSTRH